LLRERLLDVVERAVTHRLDRALDRAVGRHHDDLGHRLRALHGAEHVDAVLRAHAQIGDEDVVRARGSALGAFLAALRFVDLEASSAKHHRERGAHVALVVDDEELGH
jgi:hypothetical protein